MGDEDSVQPHVLILRDFRIAVPLSVYLSGEEVIRAHRLGNLEESITMKWSCEGEEEYEGLKCQKIRLVNSISKSGSTHDSCVLWIAEQRQKLQWREQCIVKTAELNPEYDKEFFSKVVFPDGTAMQEVKSGKIKESWRQGDR